MFRCLFLLLVSHHAYAMHPDILLPFLGNSEPWPTQQAIKQNPNWLECSESVELPLWCSDEFNYYSLSVWGEVLGTTDGKVTSLTLHKTYSRNDWTQFQLNLRRDGFGIQHANIGENRFSVNEKLGTSTPEETDRSLVLFLNRFISVFPQTLYWKHGQVRAKLETDGEEINLKFME